MRRRVSATISPPSPPHCRAPQRAFQEDLKITLTSNTFVRCSWTASVATSDISWSRLTKPPYPLPRVRKLVTTADPAMPSRTSIEDIQNAVEIRCPAKSRSILPGQNAALRTKGESISEEELTRREASRRSGRVLDVMSPWAEVCVSQTYPYLRPNKPTRTTYGVHASAIFGFTWIASRCRVCTGSHVQQLPSDRSRLRPSSTHDDLRSIHSILQQVRTLHTP